MTRKRKLPNAQDEDDVETRMATYVRGYDSWNRIRDTDTGSRLDLERRVMSTSIAGVHACLLESRKFTLSGMV